MMSLSSLTPQQWAAVALLLDEALPLTAQQRESWLAELSARTPDMAELCRQLLLAGEQSGDAAQDQLAAPARIFARALGTTQAALLPGAMIAGYRLVRLLGEGGMARVWLAEQTVGVARQIALKIPHVGLEPSAAATGRFARERDFLAGLEHERIARLYDAGITEEGIPFLSMEYIDGVPITRYCDERRMGIDARLALFNQVLEAVGFAHSRLVIHRDLKPSNILVGPNGQVKLLDFGIANLLSNPLAETPIPPQAASGGIAGGNRDGTQLSLYTLADAMTPDSASPEQLAGLPLTASSDVYSLGVVLYELLAGRKPYYLSRDSPSLHDALMAATVARLDESITVSSAELRGVAPQKLRRQLRGELESIVTRCLARAPIDRYVDVRSLQADLARFAAHEPVLAHGSDLVYRLQCLLRRQRWPVLTAALVLLIIAGGFAATEWQARRAIAQAQRAEAIQRFLLSLFRSSTPTATDGREITVKEVLARGTARVDTDLRDQPRALAELHSELGDIYNELGDNEAALAQEQRALAGFQALGLMDSQAALEALFRRGIIYMDQSQWALARADLNRVLDRGVAVFGPAHRWAVGAREKLAFIHLENDENQAALDMVREALAQPVGEDKANDALRRLRVKVIVGEAQTNLGDYRAARQTLTEVVAESNGPAGYGVVDRMVYRVLLTRAIYYEGDFLAAEPAAAQLVRDEEKVLGVDHPLVFPARQLWSGTLEGLGRYGEAVAVARETLRRAQLAPTPNPERVALSQGTLAKRLLHAARYAEAEPLARSFLAYSEAQAEGRETRPPARQLLAEILLGEGQTAAASREMDVARQEGEQLSGFSQTPNGTDLLDARANLLRVTGDLTRAAELLAQVCVQLARSPGEQSSSSRRCVAELEWVRSRLAGPASNHTAFDAAAARYAEVLPPQHPARLDLVLMSGELAAGPGASPSTAVGAAKSAWGKAFGVPPPESIVFLH